MQSQEILAWPHYDGLGLMSKVTGLLGKINIAHRHHMGSLTSVFGRFQDEEKCKEQGCQTGNMESTNVLKNYT